MRKNHTSAAITFATELIECIFCVYFFFIYEVEVAIPFVTDDFATSEAANWNDHFYLLELKV